MLTHCCSEEAVEILRVSHFSFLWEDTKDFTSTADGASLSLSLSLCSIIIDFQKSHRLLMHPGKVETAGVPISVIDVISSVCPQRSVLEPFELPRFSWRAHMLQELPIRICFLEKEEFFHSRVPLRLAHATESLFMFLSMLHSYCILYCLSIFTLKTKGSLLELMVPWRTLNIQCTKGSSWNQ